MKSKKNNSSSFSRKISQIVPPPPKTNYSGKEAVKHEELPRTLQEISKSLLSIQEISQSINESLKHPHLIEKGDIIGVSRKLIRHYGVYVGDNRVIHYTSPNSDISSNNIIMETDMSHFLRDSKTYFILDCSNLEKAMLSIPISYQGTALQDIFQFFQKHRLYSPEETVQRARSRLGEDKYNLLFNNCEHFAIWCKTGISKSHQVDEVLKLITTIPM